MMLLNYTQGYVQHYIVSTYFQIFLQKMGVGLKFRACYACVPIITTSLQLAYC